MSGALEGKLRHFAFIAILSHLNVTCLFAFGTIRPLIIFGLIEAVTKVLLSFILGRMFGIQWVMVASVIAGVPGFVYISLITLRHFNLVFKQLWYESLRPAFLSSILTGSVLLFISIYQPVFNLINFISFVSLFLLFSLVGSFFFGLLALEKKQIISYPIALRKLIFEKN